MLKECETRPARRRLSNFQTKHWFAKLANRQKQKRTLHHHTTTDCLSLSLQFSCNSNPVLASCVVDDLPPAVLRPPGPGISPRPPSLLLHLLARLAVVRQQLTSHLHLLSLPHHLHHLHHRHGGPGQHDTGEAGGRGQTLHWRVPRPGGRGEGAVQQEIQVSFSVRDGIAIQIVL